MGDTWENWSGSLRFSPERTERPENENALSDLVCRAAEGRRTIRPAGTGHSSSPLLATRDTLVSLDAFRGIESYDPAKREATLWAGTTLGEAGGLLLGLGLAMPNLGDVDVQSVAGALATGTHGSGKRLPVLSAMIAGGRMVTASGEITEFSLEEDPDLTRAAQVSLGALGIYTALTLRLLPAYRLHRREWCTTADRCFAHIGDLAERHRNFDFYWYPRSDRVKLRTMDPPGDAPESIPYARLVEDRTGWSSEVIAKVRTLRFDEMEYAVPAEVGPECFEAVRRRIRERHRKHVAWRVLYRTVAPDDAYLSIAHGRATATISLHQNATLPFWGFFNDIEPIFQEYGGRPHWAKKHTMAADDLMPLYPRWDRFIAARRRMDPDGLFLNPYLERLLGEEKA
jgi:FAD/FMN-containing dehydrogenase